MTASRVKALNKLEITTNESITFGVDADGLPVGARIIGITSITQLPSTGGPAVSEQAISNNGRGLQFRANATGGTVVPRTYTLSIIVTVKKGSIEDVMEIEVDLIVRS